MFYNIHQNMQDVFKAETSASEVPSDAYVYTGNESLEFVINSVSDKINKGLNGLGFAEFFTAFTKERVPTLTDRHLIKMLEGADFDKVAKLEVYRPENLAIPMAAHSKTLMDGLEAYKDFCKEVLEPMVKWFESAVTEKDFRDKVWSYKAKDNTSSLVSELTKSFDEKMASKRPSSSFSTLYPTIKAFEKTGEFLKEAEESIDAVDTTKIVKLEKRLVEAVRLYREEKLLSEIPSSTATNIAKLFVRIGNDMEALAVYLFETKKAIVAYNDTQEVLVSDLKKLNK